MDWRDLSDGELRARLDRRLAGDSAMAQWLTDHRDKEDVARWIESALELGVLGAPPP